MAVVADRMPVLVQDVVHQQSQAFECRQQMAYTFEQGDEIANSLHVEAHHRYLLETGNDSWRLKNSISNTDGGRKNQVNNQT
jgi:hypothetical protein